MGRSGLEALEEGTQVTFLASEVEPKQTNMAESHSRRLRAQPFLCKEVQEAQLTMLLPSSQPGFAGRLPQLAQSFLTL